MITNRFFLLNLLAGLKTASMSTPYYGNKTFLSLGKLLVRKHPELVSELLPYCDRETNLTDRTAIPRLFQSFCQLQDVSPDRCRHQPDKKGTSRRRLFTATILQLYAHQVFEHPPANPVLPYGISKCIADSLGLKKSNMSHYIRQVLFDYKNYEDFRQQVAVTVNLLNSSSHGHD